MWGRIYPHVILLVFANILKASCVGTSSLTFVIDDTGSMGNDISQVKDSANKIMDIVFNKKASLINNMVLVTVNDPDSRVRAVTQDRSTFKQALQSVKAHNYINRDCREPSIQGILLALERSLPGSFIYVFTDASAKDYHKSALITEMCQRKQSQIVFVLTGHCSDYRRKAFQVYYDIAAACSGICFFIDKNGVNQVLHTIEETIKGNKTVMTSTMVPAGKFAEIPFTVDDQTDYAIVSVSGMSVSLSIKGPHARQDKIMWHSNGKVIKLSDTTPGKYVAKVKGHTNTSVVIVGRTDFHFTHGFSALVPKTLGDTTPQPIAETDVYLSISVTDPKHLVYITSAQILDEHEKAIGKPLSLIWQSQDFYITKPFVAPSQKFKISVQGKVIATGKSISRINKIPITPPNPPRPDMMKPTAYIVEGKSIKVDYNSSVKLTCKVSGYPPPRITWVNSKGATMKSLNSTLQEPYDYISYMNTPNALKDAKFICQAVNKMEKDSQMIQVDVKDPLVVKSAPPGVTKVYYGSQGTITCDIQSILPIQIVWYYTNENKGVKEQITSSNKYQISSNMTQLKITKMDMDLVGRYSCKASLIHSNDVYKIYNTVVEIAGLIRPKLTGPTIQKVIKNATAALKCVIAEGVPVPKITWQFKATTSTKFTDITGSNGTLTVRVSKDKAGQYKCLAKNVAGQDEHVITVMIQELPEIILLPTSAYQAKEGDVLLRIPCIATGLPKPIITWKLNGHAISTNPKYSVQRDGLIIWQPTVSDTDSYTCEAKNEVGGQTAVFEINILQAPKVSGVDAKKVKIGTSANIECQIIKGVPKPKITWKFMDKSGSKFMPIAGSDTELRISSVMNKHAGRFKCVAQNNAGQAEHITTLIVQEPPKIPSSPISVYEGKEGDALLRIPCVATGLPKPIITWKLDGHVISPSTKYTIEDGVLIINNPMVSDTHSYTCEAQNEVGTETAIFQTHILQTPKVSGVPYMTVRIGTPVSIECKIVKGEPKPKITWLFMDKSASTFAPMAGLDNMLRISSVGKKDAGSYKCVAQNGQGHDEHITALTVEFPPEFTSNSSIVYQGLEGDLAIRIPCDVGGIPEPVISWKLRGVAITPSAKFAIEDGALVIKDPKKNDSASYTCEATNSLGSASAEFKVNIEEVLDKYGIEDNIYLLKGETKKLNCATLSSKFHSIRWFMNGEYNKTDESYELVNATVDMDGNYTCRASDIHGYTHTYTYVVDVGHPPKLFNSRELNVWNWRGDVTDILTKCEADAKPAFNVEWKFNDQVLTNRDIREIGISYKWGHYSCNMSNVHGSVQRSFDVKSSACLINRNLKDAQYMPLLLTDDLTWREWETTKYFSVVNTEEQVKFSCPKHKAALNVFQKFPNQTKLTALCNRQDTFLVDGNLYKLSDLQCSVSFEPTIIRKKEKCLTEKSEFIGVGYNVDGFLETYEVCYDHATDIPLYTRNIMTATDGSLNPAHKWYKYPGIGDSKVDKGFTCMGSLSSCCYSKSQLMNARDFSYDPEKYSTFIDPLNVVPVWHPCGNSRNISWEGIGELVRTQLSINSQFIAWSGTHTLQDNHGVIIPRYLWKVLRFDEDEAMAIVYVNDPSPTQKDIKCEDICIGEHWLSPKDEFTYCCNLPDFLKAFDLTSTDVGESIDGAVI